MMRNDKPSNGEEDINARRVVIGIDPASGKDSYVFAPGLNLDRPMSPSELRSLLPSRAAHEECGKKPFDTECCLVCWDAPLTGLQDPDALTVEEESKDSDAESLTTRPIERTGNDSKYPGIARASKVAGVSVRGFSGLSHWVISRNVLGLPRVGRFDAEYEHLPLQPVFNKEQLAQSRYKWVVTEVHPTLAVYLWFTDKSLGGKPDWRHYKGKGKDSDITGAVQAMWRKLCERFGSYLDSSLSLPNGEDAFDARVAWLLGFLWLNSDEVELVGSEKDGSFLLPKGVADSY